MNIELYVALAHLMVALPDVEAVLPIVFPSLSVSTILSALREISDGSLPSFSLTVAIVPLPAAILPIDMEYTNTFSLPSFTPAVTLCPFVRPVVLAEFSTSDSRGSSGMETCTDDTLSVFVSPICNSTVSPGLPSTVLMPTILSATALTATDNIIIHTSNKGLMICFVIDKESCYEKTSVTSQPSRRLRYTLLQEVSAGRCCVQIP